MTSAELREARKRLEPYRMSDRDFIEVPIRYNHVTTIGELPMVLADFIKDINLVSASLVDEPSWSEYWVDTVKNVDGTKWIAIIGKRRVDNDANV